MLLKVSLAAADEHERAASHGSPRSKPGSSSSSANITANSIAATATSRQDAARLAGELTKMTSAWKEAEACKGQLQADLAATKLADMRYQLDSVKAENFQPAHQSLSSSRQAAGAVDTHGTKLVRGLGQKLSDVDVASSEQLIRSYTPTAHELGRSPQVCALTGTYTLLHQLHILCTS